MQVCQWWSWPMVMRPVANGKKESLPPARADVQTVYVHGISIKG